MARGAAAALADARFRRWFAAQMLSASGAATQLIGMSWVVTRQTGSGVALAGLTFGVFLPVLLHGPVAGGVIDRVSRRTVLLVTQTAFLAIGVVLTVVVALGETQLWVLYAAALATGVVNAFDGPARQVFLMDLLEPGLISAAIGLYEVVINASRVIGPALAGLLLATSGVVSCFVLNAAAFVPAIVVLLLERRAGRAASVVSEPGDAAGALRFLRSRPDLTVLLVIAGVSGMLWNQSVTVPLVTTQVFGLAGGAYGVFVALFGAGALAGALRAASGVPAFRSTAIAVAVTGGLVVLSALAPSPILFGAGLVATGAVGIWFIARANAVVQLAAPPALRGRVMSVWNMALPGMNPFTGLAAGVVADVAGARAGFGLAGVLLLAVVGSGALAVRIAR